MPWSVSLATCPGAAGREVFSTWVTSVLYLKGGCYSRTTSKGSGGQGFQTSLQKAAGPPNWAACSTFISHHLLQFLIKLLRTVPDAPQPGLLLDT